MNDQADLRSLPVGTPVSILGDTLNAYKTASAPIQNSDGTTSYYIKRDDRSGRFVGMYNTRHLEIRITKGEHQHGKR